MKVLIKSIDVYSYIVKGTARYNQKAFWKIDADIFLRLQVPIESPAHAYPVGEYTFHPDSCRTGKYDNPEFDSFGLKLIPLSSKSLIDSANENKQPEIKSPLRA